MPDKEKVMSWLEGLAEPDWRDFHSDSEVQNIAKSALAMLKEQNQRIWELLCEQDKLKDMLREQDNCENCAMAIEDRQPVVRCEDCKYRSKEMYNYYDNPNNKVYVCQIHDIASKPDWFCADGVKKDDK